MNPVIMTEALWQMPRGAHADQAWGEGEIQSLGFGFGFRVFWSFLGFGFGFRGLGCSGCFGFSGLGFRV